MARLTGLAFPESRRDVLARGLAGALRRTGAQDLATVLARLATEPALLDDLIVEITIGETYFFRDPEQFRVIQDDILVPRLAGGALRRPLRIWSAGCATGEEPYSLAILLDELGFGQAAEIVGSDISRHALARARRARYSRWSLRATPPARAARYFEQSSDGSHLVSRIRQAVEFRYINLAADMYPSFASGIWGMDLILCRNVLIYFAPDTVARVAARLLDSLAPDGWLVTGASDPPLGGIVPCEVVVTAAGLAYRRAGLAAPAHPPGRVLAGDAPATEAAPRSTATRTPAGLEAREDRVEEPPAPVWTVGVAVPARLHQGQGGGATIEDARRAYEAHDYPSAAAASRRLAGADGTDPQAWVILVRSLANTGELEAAGRACAAALDRHRTCAELAYLHGVLLAEGGRQAEAAAALRGALYLDRTLVVAHLALAGVLTRSGDVQGARRALRNVARLLGRVPGTDVVPASDGARADRLTEAARVQLDLLGKEPA